MEGDLQTDCRSGGHGVRSLAELAPAKTWNSKTYKPHRITTPQSSHHCVYNNMGEPSFGTQGSPEDFHVKATAAGGPSRSDSSTRNRDWPTASPRFSQILLYPFRTIDVSTKARFVLRSRPARNQRYVILKSSPLFTHKIKCDMNDL